MPTSRQTVHELLVKMDNSSAYSNIVLDNALEKAKLDKRDKAFATSLFYGVLERRMTLDYIIRLYSTTEFDRLDTAVVELLRMGLYQLLYMDSVPESAAVNETVAMARQNVKGFVNAILRNFIRDKLEINYRELTGDAKLSIEYSCPKWLVKKWTERFGEAVCIEILKSSFGRPPLFVRVNTLKTTPDGLIAELARDKIKARRNALLEDCVEIDKISGIEYTNAYRKGLFHVQDISSQLCCKAVKPIFNETVLDMCAAPGGKSFTLAEMMANRGRLCSFDLYSGKLSLLLGGAKRLGISIIEAEANDATIYNEKIPTANKVLCDVVCSGLGVIRRKPEIKYKPMKELEAIPAIQERIIDTAARYVKSGGTLVYSTCTINSNENEDIVRRFLEEHKEFAPVVVPLCVSGVEDTYMRTFLPHQTGGDGFFAATLRKIG